MRLTVTGRGRTGAGPRSPGRVRTDGTRQAAVRGRAAPIHGTPAGERATQRRRAAAPAPNARVTSTPTPGTGPRRRGAIASTPSRGTTGSRSLVIEPRGRESSSSWPGPRRDPCRVGDRQQELRTVASAAAGGSAGSSAIGKVRRDRRGRSTAAPRRGTANGRPASVGGRYFYGAARVGQNRLAEGRLHFRHFGHPVGGRVTPARSNGCQSRISNPGEGVSLRVRMSSRFSASCRPVAAAVGTVRGAPA